jgi:hypothetical protein
MLLALAPALPMETLRIAVAGSLYFAEREPKKIRRFLGGDQYAAQSVVMVPASPGRLAEASSSTGAVTNAGFAV